MITNEEAKKSHCKGSFSNPPKPRHYSSQMYTKRIIVANLDERQISLRRSEHAKRQKMTWSFVPLPQLGSACLFQRCGGGNRCATQRRQLYVRACEQAVNRVIPTTSRDNRISDNGSRDNIPASLMPRDDSNGVDVTKPGLLVYSESLEKHAERRAEGLIPPFVSDEGEEWTDEWTLSVLPYKAKELKNQYSRVGVLIEYNFDDFKLLEGAVKASLEDITRAKARALYAATGLPSIAETHDMSIDAPESGSRINKTLQQGYYTQNVEVEANSLIDRVRPISDENRMCRFNSYVAYFDGEMEIVTTGSAIVTIVFASAQYSSCATASALDDMYKELTKRLGLSLYRPGERRGNYNIYGNDEERTNFVGAIMLRERIMRDGRILGDGIVKVSSFLNHMVDVELMEECGIELAERLRSSMPNKILTVESTGLIPAIPVAKKLGIPLVFARKSRPITISDSFQTTYRSSTKGTVSELVVSCEYLHAADRVLIIDDFLAGGSTAEALFKLANMARAKVVAVGVLIEKMASGGRAFLSGYNVPVESLAKVDVVEESGSQPRLTVREEEPWCIEPMEKYDDDDEFGVSILEDDEDEFDNIEDTLVRERK